MKFNLHHSLLLVSLIPAIFVQAQASSNTHDLLNVKCPKPADFKSFLTNLSVTSKASYEKVTGEKFTKYNITSKTNTMTDWLVKVNGAPVFIVVDSCNKQVDLPSNDILNKGILTLVNTTYMPDDKILICNYQLWGKKVKKIKIELASNS
jgi:hypothetical protein